MWHGRPGRAHGRDARATIPCASNSAKVDTTGDTESRGWALLHLGRVSRYPPPAAIALANDVGPTILATGVLASVTALFVSKAMHYRGVPENQHFQVTGGRRLDLAGAALQVGEQLRFFENSAVDIDYQVI